MAYVDIAYDRDPATGAILFDANGYPDFATNAGANTYGQLQARIANEVLGSPTTADIQNAIQDAIVAYERESFWFNSIRSFGSTGSASDLTTVQGQEFYSAIDLPVLANFPHMSKIMVLAFGNRYPLISRTPQWIDDQSFSPTWQSMPTDWATSSGSDLRLYPIPNQAYQLIIDATIRFAPLTADADYNCWTNRAEALIRFEAKRLLFKNITRDAEQALAMELEIFGDLRTGRQGALAMLRRESMRRAGGPGKIRASRGYL